MLECDTGPLAEKTTAVQVQSGLWVQRDRQGGTEDGGEGGTWLSSPPDLLSRSFLFSAIWCGRARIWIQGFWPAVEERSDPRESQLDL